MTAPAPAPTDAGALREALATVLCDCLRYDRERGIVIGIADAVDEALAGPLASLLAQRDAALAERDEARKKLDCPIGIPVESRRICSAGTCWQCLADRCVWSKEQIKQAARATTDADLAKARDRIAGLEAALSSILPGKLCGEISGVPDESRTTISITFGQIRTARAALTHGGDRGEN